MVVGALLWHAVPATVAREEATAAPDIIGAVANGMSGLKAPETSFHLWGWAAAVRWLPGGGETLMVPAPWMLPAIDIGPARHVCASERGTDVS
jgi:hypothetical protein